MCIGTLRPSGSDKPQIIKLCSNFLPNQNFVMEDENKMLKVALHSMISEQCEKMKVQITPESLIAMTEISYEQGRNFGRDLDHFAKHAKRATVTKDDIKLLFRKHPDLQEKLQNSIQE